MKDGKTVFRLNMMLDSVEEVYHTDIYNLNSWIVESAGIMRMFMFIGLLLTE